MRFQPSGGDGLQEHEVSREVRFQASDEEYAMISEHVSKKHRWKKVSDFARYCVFKEMEVHAPGAHHAKTGNPVGRPRNTQKDKTTVEIGENSVPRLYQQRGAL